LSDSADLAPPGVRRDVVLHIGTMKTGSSSVQQHLMSNRDRLRNEGVLYPTPPGAGRHFDLGLAVKTPAQLEENKDWRRIRSRYSSAEQFRRRYRRRLLAELGDSDAPRVLFSDEALCGATVGEVRRLRALLDGFAESVTVLVYLRRQDDLLLSRYQQAVRSGEFRRMPEWLAREPDEAYDYRTMLARFRTVLRPDAVVVRRFESAAFEGGSLYQDFLAAIGVQVPAAELASVATQNEGLGADAVEFLRLLNVLLTERGVPRVEIRHRPLVERLWAEPAGPSLSLSDEAMDEFTARWSAANEEVAREYLGDASGTLFRAPHRAREVVTEQRITAERIDHFLDLLELPADLRAPLHALAG
jgi:hypothetical protein